MDRVSLSVSLKRAQLVLDERGGGVKYALGMKTWRCLEKLVP